MMWWYGNGMGGWGMALMMIGNVLFWAVVVLAAIALIRDLTVGSRGAGPRPTPPDRGQPGSSAPAYSRRTARRAVRSGRDR
jgi:hypothetical protein